MRSREGGEEGRENGRRKEMERNRTYLHVYTPYQLHIYMSCIYHLCSFSWGRKLESGGNRVGAIDEADFSGTSVSHSNFLFITYISTYSICVQ